MKTRTSIFLSTIISIVLLYGCGINRIYINKEFVQSSPVVIPAEEIESTVYLIGDAGKPSFDVQEPSLAVLQKEVSINQVKSKLIIFLGDNIYESGMPEQNSPDRKEKERCIDEQIKVIRESNAKGIFIPGNHDWNHWSAGGAEAVKRQEQYISSKSNEDIKFLPTGACPGPEIVDFGLQLRIIILDSQWWLMDKEDKGTPLCDSKSEDEVLNKLEEAIKDAGNRKILVVAHHPLDSYSEHSGFFSWKEHLFPLRILSKSFWIPLPIVGSLYPLVRNMGITSQDFSSSKYKHLISKMKDVLFKYPLMAYACGHEHTLQILKEENGMLTLISGAGLEERMYTLTTGENSIFASSSAGFMSLDILKNGKVLLHVVTANGENGTSNEVFSIWIGKE